MNNERLQYKFWNVNVYKWHVCNPSPLLCLDDLLLAVIKTSGSNSFFFIILLKRFMNTNDRSLKLIKNRDGRAPTTKQAKHVHSANRVC